MKKSLYKNRDVKKDRRTPRGQAITEYILILAFSLSIGVLFIKTLSKYLDKGILTFGGRLEKQLKVGRAPANLWKN